jgi:predicted Fe-Mo cluster-binding NifX family protein
MRIAISSDEDRGLDSTVSPHFGRCPYFVLVNMEGREVQDVETVSNPFYSQHRPGQVPFFIDQQGVNVMLTGGMGRRAIDYFRQFDIEPVTGAYGTVRHSLEQYLGGALRDAAPCRESVAHNGDDDEHVHLGYEKDQAGRLREEAGALQRQLDEVMGRLNALDE